MRIVWRLNPVVGIVEVCLWFDVTERVWHAYDIPTTEFGPPTLETTPKRLWSSLDILDDDVPSVYSFPLATETIDVLRRERKRLEASSTGDVRVKTLYHGTATDRWESIKTNGLRESEGMLGIGVYLTHASRAANRYGARDKDYLARAAGMGCVVRVYLMYEDDDNFAHSEDYECECSSCSSKEDAVKRVCDHDSLWQTRYTKHGVRALATPKADGEHWVIRSTEWCVLAEGTFVQDAVMLDAALGVYDPDDASIHPLPA